ncbi:helix-turn-helix domain-containing protein [Coraliomargarita parva]|uniref:helix-turn-helix domain-containing protein n=1 Tax=Coraliomargarita parva TaxID=3014050 RepID=UPI0022B54250|nr:AraC family transcriptional regulator [Coraliomargarita parva]
MDTQLYYSNWHDLTSYLIWIYKGKPVRIRGRYENQYLSAWLILRGHLHFGQNPAQPVNAGNWVFLPVGQESHVFSKDAEIISVKFTLKWPDGQMLYNCRGLQVLPKKQFPSLRQSAEALLRFTNQHSIVDKYLSQQKSLDLKSYIQTHQLYQNWLLAYMEAMQALNQDMHISHRVDERVLAAKKMLDTHSLEKPLQLKAVAAKAGLSFGHTDALFHKNYGQTMRSYFDNRKYLAAQHWLAKTDQPIKEIAFKLGFKDTAACTHWFKKKSGVPPLSYRQSHA